MKKNEPVFGMDERLWAALLTVLDAVDYTTGACSPTEAVGAVLPGEVIRMARGVADEYKKQRPRGV